MNADEFLDSIKCPRCGSVGSVFGFSQCIMIRLHDNPTTAVPCKESGAMYDPTPDIAEHVENLMIKAQKTLSRSKT